MIPVCHLYIERELTNPPKPVGFVVYDDLAQAIGVISYDDVQTAMDRYDNLYAAWSERTSACES